MKEEIRKKYLNIRKNIINREAKDLIIYNKVINNPKVIESQTILIYVSFNNEVDTLKLIKYFLKTKLVAVPKVEDNLINFYYINSLDDLKIGKYHILEPITTKKAIINSKTIAITPGICFSYNKERIGYGKGYYDRFYHKYHLYKIGLCYQECLINHINSTNYDIKMDEVISD